MIMINNQFGHVIFFWEFKQEAILLYLLLGIVKLLRESLLLYMLQNFSLRSLYLFRGDELRNFTL